MAECSLQEKIRNGIQEKANTILTESGQFERIDRESVRVITSDNFVKNLVEQVNTEFGEELIQEKNELEYIIEPSEQLVNKYLEVANQKDEQSFPSTFANNSVLNFSQAMEIIVKEFKLKKTESFSNTYKTKKNKKASIALVLKLNDYIKEQNFQDIIGVQYEKQYGTINFYSKSKSNVDVELRNKYFSERNETTSKEILLKIANSNSNLSLLAKRLLRYSNLFNPSVILQSEDIDKTNDAGTYYNKENKILIYEFANFKGTSEATIIHEIIHAYTVDFIKNNKNASIVKDLDNVLNYLRNNKTKFKDQYPLKDVYELTAEFFTNSQFIKDLKNIPAENKFGNYKNLWEEILAIISQLFNFNRLEKNLYQELFPLMTNVFKEAKDYEEIKKQMPLWNEIVEDYENTIDLLNTEHSGMIDEYMDHSEFPLLAQIGDEINEKNDNVVTTISQNNIYPNEIKLNVFHNESIPEHLQNELVDKSYSAYEVGKITMNKTLQKLSKVFPELKFKFVNAYDLNQKDHKLPISEIKSFIKESTVYLVEDRFDKNSTLDEFLHPFTYGLYEKNNILFTKLFNENKEKYKDVYNFYKKIGEKEAQIEVVNNALVFNVDKENSLFKEFIAFLKKVLQKLFPFSNKIIETQNISTNLKVEELANYLLNGGYKFEHFYTQDPFYNAKSPDVQKQLKIREAILQNPITYELVKLNERDEYGQQLGYTSKGIPVARTSDITSKENDERFKNYDGAQRKKIENRILAEEHGSGFHAALEDVLKRWIDPVTGFRRKGILATKNIGTVSEDVYNTAETFITNFLNEFDRPEGEAQPVFLIEQLMFNPSEKNIEVRKRDADGNVISKEWRNGLASTIDLIVITPEAKLQVYDWKTITSEKEEDIYESVTSAKRQTWETQLSSYVNAVMQATDVQKNDFEKVRVIPFIRKYEWNPFTREKDFVGIITPEQRTLKNLDLRKLQPFISQREFIENTNVREYLNRIEALIQINLEKHKAENTYLSYAEAEEFTTKVNNALTDFKQYGVISTLKDLHAEMAEEARLALLELNSLEVTEDTFFTPIAEQINTLYRLISAIADFKTVAKVAYGPDLNQLTEQRIDPNIATEEEEMLEDIKDLNTRLENLKDSFIIIQKNIAKAFAKRDANIEDVTMEEVRVTSLNYSFTNPSYGDTRSVLYFASEINKRWPKVQLNIQAKQKEIGRLKHEILKNNGNIQERFEKLLAYDKNNKFLGKFKNRFKPTFFEYRTKILETGDITALNKFLDMFFENPEAIRAEREQYLQNALAKIEATDFGSMSKTQKDKIKAIQIEKAHKKYDLNNNKEAFSFLKNRPFNEAALADDFYQDWYVDMKKNDKPLFNFYQNCMEINREVAHAKGIEWSEVNTFIPNFEQSNAERGLFNIWENIKRKLEINSNSGQYGKVDPATGKQISSVNLIGATDFFKGNYTRKSKDLATSYALFAMGLEEYKVKTQLEPLAKLLLRLEENKKVMDIDWRGNLKMKTESPNEPMSAIYSDVNFKYLKQFVEAFIYDRKIQGDGFDATYDVIDPKTNEKTSYSVANLLQLLTNNMYASAFALNFTTPIRTKISGSINNKLLGTTHFLPNQVDALKSIKQRFKQRLNNSENDKELAMIGFFMPYINNDFAKKAKEMSVYGLTKWFNYETLTQLMGESDFATQLEVFNALISNSIIVNGRLVNTREYVRALPEFAGMNSIQDAVAFKEKEKEFETKIKELNKEKGILQNSEVKNGEFIIKGLDNDQAIIDAISKISSLSQYYSRRVTGMSPEWDRAGHKNSMFWRLLTPFRTWINDLARVRWGGLKYNAQIHDYEWGKHLSYFNSIKQSTQEGILATLKTFIGMGSREMLLKYAADSYEEYKKQAIQKNKIVTGTFLSKEEFFRMYLENIQLATNELKIMLTLFVLITLPFVLGGGEGEDEEWKKTPLMKIARFQTDRLLDEFLFYYHPGTVGQIVKGTIPLVSYVDRLSTAVANIPQIPFSDTPLKNVKKVLNPIPGVSETFKIMPIFFPELAKEMGITVATSNNFIK